MSKETISPAPWHDNGNEIVDGNGKVIGGAFSNEDGALMAAAPTLLAALHNLEVAANSVRYCYDRRPENFAMALESMKADAEVAREAIAKATGAA